MRKIVALTLAIVMGLLLFGCAPKNVSLEFVSSELEEGETVEGEFDKYGSLVVENDLDTSTYARKTPSVVYHNSDEITMTDISAYQKIIQDDYWAFVVVTMDVSELSKEEMRQLFEEDISCDMFVIEEPGPNWTGDMIRGSYVTRLDEDAQRMYVICYCATAEDSGGFASAECITIINLKQDEDYEVKNSDIYSNTKNRTSIWQANVNLKDKIADPEKAPDPVKGYLEDLIDELA